MADTKAKIIYTELLKEDLVVIRLVPENWYAKIQNWSISNYWIASACRK